QIYITDQINFTFKRLFNPQIRINRMLHPRKCYCRNDGHPRSYIKLNDTHVPCVIQSNQIP
ncbi:MAG: hypothetical protein K2G34_11895, partial [Bacteroides sp.]|nr:hypothetical protein [Bacteroides sp.]